MEAKELRIGNWVNYEGENIQLFLSQIGEFLEDAHELKPIPLTVDWLLKFGFDKKPLHTHHGNGQDWRPEYPKTVNQDYVINNDFVVRFEAWHYMSKQKINVDYSTQICYGSDWYENISENSIYCSMEHVHQLQNLYFALTNKELTINTLNNE